MGYKKQSLKSLILIFTFIWLCFPVHSDALEEKSEKKDESATEKKEVLEAPEETSEKIPEKKKETEADLFEKELLEIVEQLKKHYPAFSKTLSGNKKDEIIRNFLKDCHAGIEYTNSIKEPKTEKKKAFERGIMISSNRIFYLRIDSFDDASLKKIKEDCEASARMAKPPVGLIIDLRSCSGGDQKNVLKLLALFCGKDKLPENSLDKSERVFKLPVAIITSEKTSGPAESFIYYMDKARQGLTIGAYTAGAPFVKKAVMLNSGKYLLIPEVPENMTDMPVEPLKPAIKLKDTAQISFKEISGKLGSEKKDKCISRAVDLLISLHALKDKF